jgi:DNA invertase Pin-like site-specific DNA recombinase
MVIYDETHFAHYGTPRHSGRYPWGSGGDDYEEWGDKNNRDFLDFANKLKKEGMSEPEIAKAMGLSSTTELRIKKSNATEEQRLAKITQINRLAEAGNSNTKIGELMGLNESSVRALRAPGAADKASAGQTTANTLKRQVEEKGMIDTSKGVEHQLGITRNRLDTAVGVLRDQGYAVHNIYLPQVTQIDKNITMRVLAKPGTTMSEIEQNRVNIRQINEWSDDGGRSYITPKQPISLSARRVAIKYGKDGGAKEDGVIYVRRGKEDLSLGQNNYGQVRILVDGTHYLKGMAVYNDKLPDGVDVLFNTAKENTGRKKDAMKEIETDDPLNPFGSIIRQHMDEKGNVTSVMNMVGSPTRPESGEAGQWDGWSVALSSQMLSKQDPKFIQQQLDRTFDDKLRDFDEINSLTNPTVRRQLLLNFAEQTDASAVDLKAASLKGTANRVLLPIPSMKPTEIYSPNFNDGDRVVLIRHPHAGTFEIPELTVNNRNREARRLIGTGPNVIDAVGIHQSVAERLSGADFDGDTVLVIPNKSRQIKTSNPLQDLKGFDKMVYKLPKDSPIPRMTKERKQAEMGKISNLITDMSLRGAKPEELARAVKHSMVVIDAEKHELNFKQSEKDHGILALKQQYQKTEGNKGLGASTLISRARAPERVPQFKPRPAREGGPIDPVTGKKVFVLTGATVPDRSKPIDPATGKRPSKIKEVPYDRLSLTDDAHTLSSGTRVEIIYAEHSNKLKALANETRKEALPIKNTPYDSTARKVYAKEVESLNAKLRNAERNKPYERQAQIYANASIGQIRQQNPGMPKDELDKHKQIQLTNARNRTGAERYKFDITQEEWNAIQAGAISGSKLERILLEAKPDNVKKLAMPKSHTLMTPAKTARARQMIANGATQAEAAAALGVSLTTLKVGISE